MPLEAPVIQTVLLLKFIFDKFEVEFEVEVEFEAEVETQLTSQFSGYYRLLIRSNVPFR